VELGSAEVLVREGEPGDAAYLMTAGRLVATVDGAEVGVVVRGETVGEMALITGEARTATVTACRPSRLVRIGADQFATVLAAHPDAYRGLTSILVERLERTLRGRPTWVGHATVVGLASPDGDLSRAFADSLSAALAAEGARVGRFDGSDGGALGHDSRRLADLEAANDIVLVTATAAALSGDAHGCDRTLLVARVDRPIPDVPAGRFSDLVLVHPPSTELPSGTARWLDRLAPTGRHHHLRDGSARDLASLARRLLYRERVLVLGGGGARGLAHLGTYRALCETGVDIDAVYGVSAGAVFGAEVALDRTPEQAVERAAKSLIDAPRLVDLTVPVVALSSGRRVTDTIRNGFEGIDLEDLWRPMTCLSTDLASLSARVHRRGPMWRAVRASVAVPGVFPPLVEGDAVLVDGGVVDNLPVARARRLHPGATVISSDVGRRHEILTADFPPDGVIGGLRTTWERVGQRRRNAGLVKLLYRLTALGGGALEAQEGDIHIDHRLDGIGMFDFAGARPAIDAGYRLTLQVLEEAADLLDRGR
jgi:NTE family protein